MLERRTELARQIALQLLGAVDAIEHQPYGHAGFTFEVRCRSGDFILKTSDRPGAYDHTEYHITVMRSLEVPAPTVLKRGSFEGLDYMLLAKIPGRDLGNVMAEMKQVQLTSLAEQVVAIERKVTSLPKGEGFGWTPMRMPGPFPSWTAVIERDSKNSPAEVRKVLAQWKDYFDRIEPVCFPDDLTVKNVIVQDGELQGIVDLDEVCYGDPLYWLSLAEVTSVLDCGLQGAFYGKELRGLWGVTDETSAVCDLYNIVQAWFFLGKGIVHADFASWTKLRMG